jgi:GNAT superfamily N-acetyltransferase
MYVDQQARGMRVGVALVAELEAAAKLGGMRRLFLETWPRHVPALEKFGFRPCASWGEFAPSEHSMCMEKTLTASSSRLA